MTSSRNKLAFLAKFEHLLEKPSEIKLLDFENFERTYLILHNISEKLFPCFEVLFKDIQLVHDWTQGHMVWFKSAHNKVKKSVQHKFIEI